jgi:hypothetical protein
MCSSVDAKIVLNTSKFCTRTLSGPPEEFQVTFHIRFILLASVSKSVFYGLWPCQREEKGGKKNNEKSREREKSEVAKKATVTAAVIVRPN